MFEVTLAIFYGMIIVLGLLTGWPRIKKMTRELIEIFKGKEIKL